MAHTEGPWFWCGTSLMASRGTHSRHVMVAERPPLSPTKPDMDLIAAAPDHALVGRALCSGAARWEPWPDGVRGEVCIYAIRHATRLDGFGIPEVTPALRVELARATTPSTEGNEE